MGYKVVMNLNVVLDEICPFKNMLGNHMVIKTDQCV